DAVYRNAAAARTAGGSAGDSIERPDPAARGATGGGRTVTRRPSLPREPPRLCRGGSRSLTFPAVAHRRNADLSHHAQEKSFRDGPALMGLPTSEENRVALLACHCL